MELFAQILGMTMMVLGLIGLIACVSGLLYNLWMRDKQGGQNQADPASATDEH